jgi:hypothetical protein
MNRHVALCAVVLLATAACFAAEPAIRKSDEQRAKYLEQMRSLARATHVCYEEGDSQPQLVDSPVFRYDDQPRRFLDATMWVWTDAGRPVAFEKIEVMLQDRPRWGYCFTSVADCLLTAKWDERREFHSTEPGIEYLPLADAPAVPARTSARKLEARKLARDFSARILTDDRANTSEEMRLLPTPIFDYTDPDTKAFLGAVFGLTTSGTNPDVLLLLEPRDAENKLVWHYAAARMTIGGVTLKYRGNIVWQVDYCPPRPTDFPTWTFFTTLRDEATGREAAE